METIRKKFKIFGLSTVLGVAVSIFIYFSSFSAREINTAVLFVSGLGTILLALLWRKEYDNLKAARLIIENCIVRIRSAVIEDKIRNVAEDDHTDGVEVFVSNFGILLDSRIIKFNQGAAQLKAVEIGANFIGLTYGTEEAAQKIRLLSGGFGEGELKEVVEKFRFETGVDPVIVDP
ncbi:MAG: hypothetical protein GX883_00610 [Firmicutes bacterium]|nr:hypothetical protein [Bacillota bacterium]